MLLDLSVVHKRMNELGYPNSVRCVNLLFDWFKFQFEKRVLGKMSTCFNGLNVYAARIFEKNGYLNFASIVMMMYLRGLSWLTSLSDEERWQEISNRLLGPSLLSFVNTLMNPNILHSEKDINSKRIDEHIKSLFHVFF